MNANVIIVGGGPAGIITALTTKSVYPDLSVCLIKDIGDGVIPCAIPYMMQTLSDPNQNAMGNMPLEKAGIDILVGKVVRTGAKPANLLAQKAGLRLAENGSIWVDEYMRTDAEDVFAVGDCAVKRDFFTRKAAPVWLASTATAEARNAGTNIYGIRVLHQIQGTIAAFTTKIGGISFASAGMTCRACQKEGFRF